VDEAVRVVTAFEDVRRYLGAARHASPDELGPLHRKHILEPQWQDCAAGGELEEYAARAVCEPIRDLDALEASLAQLEGSGVEGIAERAWAGAHAALPGPSTTIWVLPADPGNIFIRDFMRGVQATTAGAGKIWLHLSPPGDWRTLIPPAIAHEHHHSVWLHRHCHGADWKFLLNYLVFEGRACAFSRMLYGQARQPWTETLNPQQEAEVWQAMKPQLPSHSEQVMVKFMFGGVEGVPLLAGYTVGDRIVRAFLAGHPGLDVDTWTAMDADELLAASGYDGPPRDPQAR